MCVARHAAADGLPGDRADGRAVRLALPASCLIPSPWLADVPHVHPTADAPRATLLALRTAGRALEAAVLPEPLADDEHLRPSAGDLRLVQLAAAREPHVGEQPVEAVEERLRRVGL